MFLALPEEHHPSVKAPACYDLRPTVVQLMSIIQLDPKVTFGDDGGFDFNFDIKVGGPGLPGSGP